MTVQLHDLSFFIIEWRLFISLHSFVCPRAMGGWCQPTQPECIPRLVGPHLQFSTALWEAHAPLCTKATLASDARGQSDRLEEQGEPSKTASNDRCRNMIRNGDCRVSPHPFRADGCLEAGGHAGSGLLAGLGLHKRWPCYH